MQDTFARATHSAYAAGRPSAARDDRVSCIQDADVRGGEVVFEIRTQPDKGRGVV